MTSKSFKIKTPDYKTKVKDSFDRQPFMKFLGAILSVVEPGYCEIHLNFKKELTQQHGYFHAGVIGTLADNAAGYAAFSLMEVSSSVLTVEFKLNLISPGDGDKLISKAHVLKNGKTLTVCRCDLYVVKGKTEKLCAEAQMTLIELKNRIDH